MALYHFGERMRGMKTILKQLGGNKFIAMTGARDFVAGKNNLSFKIPRAKKEINYIFIKLTLKDTYIMGFGINSLSEYKTIDIVNNVYFDQLQEVFTENTGLNCSL